MEIIFSFKTILGHNWQETESKISISEDFYKVVIQWQLTSGGFCVRLMVGVIVGLFAGLTEGDLDCKPQFGPAAQKELDESLGVSWYVHPEPKKINAAELYGK